MLICVLTQGELNYHVVVHSQFPNKLVLISQGKIIFLGITYSYTVMELVGTSRKTTFADVSTRCYNRLQGSHFRLEHLVETSATSSCMDASVTLFIAALTTVNKS